MPEPPLPPLPQDRASQHAGDLLRALVVGTAAATGTGFFKSLVQQLAETLGARYVFLTECDDGTNARALAFWNSGKLGDNFEYPIAGTPCQAVIGGSTCQFGSGLQGQFPEDATLVDWNAESYLGVPIEDDDGHIMGHIAVVDDKPMPSDGRAADLLKIFASRAAAELRRIRAREELQQTLRKVQDLEQRSKTLLEINNLIISSLTHEALFHSITMALRSTIAFDRSAIFLHDMEKNVLRLFAAESEQLPREHFVPGWEVPLEGSLGGWVFLHQKPLLRRDLAKEKQYKIEEFILNQGFNSALLVPLIVRGRSIGTLNLASRNVAQYSESDVEFLQEVAGQIALAIENMRAYDLLQRKHAQSEERYQDLFDEAPIAYVHEGLDTKFIRANRAALRALGIKAEDVPQTYGRDFVPKSPEAQKRLHEAFQSLGAGSDSAGVVLELQRRDTGEPLWIQWWSRPDPSGTYTRTMFIDITERVLMEREKARLEAQNVYLQEEIQTEHNFQEIVGNHRSMIELLRQVETVAPTDSTVLIMGETGTGKELIARAIHNSSRRSGRPLVKVNCGAIPTGLVESELFGHMKGAFTGALERRIGRFELADGGTLFLDEVSELPLDTQVKLLRVLQEHEFEPIGGNKTLKVNVRIIAASNRDMEKAIAEGRFRADLYYRLNVLPIVLPPLRERKSDIKLLVAFFLDRFNRQFGKSISQISNETMEQLLNYDWPGNIRELQNVMERAVVLSGGPELKLGTSLVLSTHLGDSNAVPPKPALEKAANAAANPASLADVQRQHILDALGKAGWVIDGPSGAAQALALHPNTLRSRMKKLGLHRPAGQ